MHPIKKWRDDEKMNLRKAASLAGVCPETWRKVESGISLPSLLVTYRLHVATGVPMVGFVPDHAKTA